MIAIENPEGNVLLWAEPVTGILYLKQLLTHFSMSATWLPGVNGTAIDPATGKSYLPETTTNTIRMIEQSEAAQTKNLYSVSELYGSESESQKYKTFTTPPAESLDFWSILPPIATHLGVSVLINN